MWAISWKIKTLDKVGPRDYCTESVYPKPLILMALTNQHALAAALLRELSRKYPEVVEQALQSEAHAKDLTLGALRIARSLFPANLERFVAAPVRCQR